MFSTDSYDDQTIDNLLWDRDAARKTQAHGWTKRHYFFPTQFLGAKAYISTGNPTLAALASQNNYGLHPGAAEYSSHYLSLTYPSLRVTYPIAVTSPSELPIPPRRICSLLRTLTGGEKVRRGETERTVPSMGMSPMPRQHFVQYASVKASCLYVYRFCASAGFPSLASYHISAWKLSVSVNWGSYPNPHGLQEPQPVWPEGPFVSLLGFSRGRLLVHITLSIL